MKLFALTVLIVCIAVVSYYFMGCWQKQRMLKTQEISTKIIDSHVFSPTTIPVWTYWEGQSSALVTLCLQRITESCKLASNRVRQFQHIHLEAQTIQQYIPDIESHICYANATHLKSDVLRLSLLSQYGGFWLDASILVLVPIDQLFIDFDENIFQAYFNPDNGYNLRYPVIETSVLYAPPRHKLIQAWLAETDSPTSCTEIVREKYVNDLPFRNKVFKLNNTYHFVYFTLLKVLHDNRYGIQSFDNVRLFNTKVCQYFCFQSFRIADLHTLTTQEFRQKYCLTKCTMIKFIASERDQIDKQFHALKESSFLRSKGWKPCAIVSRSHAKDILKQIHEKTHLSGGKQDEEYVEQLMSVQFIPSTATVLELGSNIGRNTIVIASLLSNQNNLVTLECDPEAISVLTHNRTKNNMTFLIEPAALSRRRLSMSFDKESIKRDTHDLQSLTPSESEREVQTISVKGLKSKYSNLVFDTLVADVEGALYNILLDEPDLLDTMQLILMENDYHDIKHKTTVDKMLIERGFKRVFVEKGGWGPCSDFFWEVWRK